MMRILGIAAMLLLVSSSASAHDGIPFRLGLSAGGWEGTLNESFLGQTSSLRITPAWAGAFFLGIEFGPVFIDWSPTYFGVGKIGSGDSSGSSYSTLEAGEAGLSLGLGPLLLEPYVGYESGTLGFATGTQSQFGGNSIKAGINFLIFHTSPLARLGVRAEARRNYFTLQNSGSAPVDVSSSSYYLGLVFLFTTAGGK